jgi:hypothetical protein
VRFRKLRMAWSVFWGVACVLAVVLWVRSYWTTTYIVCQISNSSYIQMSLMPGTFGVMASTESSVPAWTVIDVSSEKWVEYYDAQWKAGNPVMGKHWSRFWGGFYFAIGKNFPFWFLLAVLGTMGIVPWLQWSNRFSLRTLVIATTLVSVVLGLAVYAASK